MTGSNESCSMAAVRARYSLSKLGDKILSMEQDTQVVEWPAGG